MPSLREYLPGIPSQYWRLYEKVISPSSPIVLEPGTSDYGILPEPISNERGLFSHFTLTTNSDKLTATFTVDDISANISVSSLVTAGLVGYYVAEGPWLSVASSSIPLYVVNVIYPNLEPFYRNISLSVSNPSSSPIEIISMAFGAYILNPGFYKELAKLIRGELP